MLNKEIEKLRGILNEMVINDCDSNVIYDLSIKLDELIVNYYNQIGYKQN